MTSLRAAGLRSVDFVLADLVLVGLRTGELVLAGLAPGDWVGSLRVAGVQFEHRIQG
jgi:hypothetical protein